MKFTEKYGIIIFIIFLLSIFLKIGWLGAFIVGALVLIEAISMSQFLKKIRYSGIRCMGRIISYQRGYRGLKTPVIEFTSSDGDKVTEQPRVYVSTDVSIFRSYSKYIDTEVEIIYDPDDPTQFMLADEKEFSYAGVVICILAGVFVIGLSVYIFLGYLPVH